ncbi:MAG: hypothetical protein U0556_19010 [Dehalococcoidia bacterium]
MDRPINGIWFNKETGNVLRVNSPYYKDEVAKPNWVFLTDEVNMTLVRVRELASERGLADDPTSITWS